jgi:hypothetical protein
MKGAKRRPEKRGLSPIFPCPLFFLFFRVPYFSAYFSGPLFFRPLFFPIGKPCAGEPLARFDEGGQATVARVRLLRHRQTKGAATDRLGLRAQDACSLLYPEFALQPRGEAASAASACYAEPFALSTPCHARSARGAEASI